MGQYLQGVIEIVKNPRSTTGYHEAFHAYTDMFADPKIKKAAFDEVRKLLGKKKNKLNKDTLEEVKYHYDDVNDLFVEEYLAETFANWKLAGKTPTGKVKQFLEQVWDSIKSLFGKEDKILKMFKDAGGMNKKSRPSAMQQRLYQERMDIFKNKTGVTTRILDELSGK